MTATPPSLRGRLAVVGLGPGSSHLCTPEVRDLLIGATDWVGYRTYIDLATTIVTPTPAQRLHRTGNRVEAERARAALDLAAEGRAVAIISSGDPGIFAMAAAVIEQLDCEHSAKRWASVDVSVHPGVSAAQVAAARAGAPLGHDFCVISLSDNLKPWSVIERRLDAAAGADFVLALYNPRSRHRPDQLAHALAVIRRHRSPDTPVVLGHNVGRPSERVRTVTLGALDATEVGEIDMATVVIVGSSRTATVTDERAAADGRAWTYTPRSYPD